MKEDTVIEVSNITKSFRVYLDKGHTLKEMTLFQKRRKYEERKVLKGISFEVKKGEAIGLIGQNGCGKSTTLKLLTRIMYPDSGTIEMKGRVSSLIELGAGFHPDMSGRQNIYTNASIFGLTKKEIDARLEDIIAFSELEEFIDNPVRTYSSGMYMRLAFAVAINVDADILLIDEILAVGDANFQAKCFNKMREIKTAGTTIVIVSHSMGQIEQICDRSIWIQDGEIRRAGRTYDVDMEYLDFMSNKRQEDIEEQDAKNRDEIEESKSSEKKSDQEEAQKKERWGNKKVKISKIRLSDIQGKEKTVYKTGERIKIHVSYKKKEAISDAVFGIGIFRSDGLQCYGTNTKIDRLSPINIKADGEFSITIENQLLPGEYYIDVAIEENPGVPVDYYTKAKRIEVFSEMGDVGVSRQKHQWDVPR